MDIRESAKPEIFCLTRGIFPFHILNQEPITDIQWAISVYLTLNLHVKRTTEETIICGQIFSMATNQ